MQTILKSKSKSVTIDNEAAFVVIGESINPTRRKKLTAAFTDRNYNYVMELADSQIKAGADVLDINVGVPGLDEVSLLPDVVTAVTAQFDTPLCLDSPNPQALAAALAVAPERTLVNSVNGEEASLNAILPIVKEFNAPVIGLTMDDDGISMDVDKRVAIAGKIIERAAKLGIPSSDVVIDPLVMAVSADHNAGKVTLETIQRIHDEFDANITMGASNVSFGLPLRSVINQAFMAIAISVGTSCAITNPVHLTNTIRAADLLLGRDFYSMRYIQHYRQTQKS